MERENERERVSRECKRRARERTRKGGKSRKRRDRHPNGRIPLVVKVH